MDDAITIPTRMKCLYLNGGLNRSPVATLAKRILSLQTGRSVKSCNQAELKGTVHVIVSLLRCSIITNDTCKGLNSVRLVRLVGEVVISMGGPTCVESAESGCRIPFLCRARGWIVPWIQIARLDYNLHALSVMEINVHHQE